MGVTDLELEQVIKDTTGCAQRKGMRCSDCTSMYRCGLEMAAELRSLADSLNRAAALLRKTREQGNKNSTNAIPMKRCKWCGAMIVYRGLNYCPSCGRRMEWND